MPMEGRSRESDVSACFTYIETRESEGVSAVARDADGSVELRDPVIAHCARVRVRMSECWVCVSV